MPPQQICTLLRSPWQPDGVRQSHVSSSASLSSSPPAPLSLPSPAPPLPVHFRLSLSVSLFLPPSPLLPLSSSPSLLGGRDAELINVLLMRLCELRPSFHPSALAHLRCLLILFSSLLLSVCSPCFWPPPPLYSSLPSFSVLLCLGFTSFPLLSLHLSCPPLFSPPLSPLLLSPLLSLLLLLLLPLRLIKASALC